MDRLLTDIKGQYSPPRRRTLITNNIHDLILNSNSPPHTIGKTNQRFGTPTMKNIFDLLQEFFDQVLIYVASSADLQEFFRVRGVCRTFAARFTRTILTETPPSVYENAQKPAHSHPTTHPHTTFSSSISRLFCITFQLPFLDHTLSSLLSLAALLPRWSSMDRISRASRAHLQSSKIYACTIRVTSSLPSIHMSFQCSGEAWVTTR
jgi:hypothetical protein